MVHFIFWKTLNKKKHQMIMESCKDLGLKRLQRGAFLGKIERNERKSLEEILRRYLTGARDNFYIIPLCNDCWSISTDKEICALIKEQLRVADTVVFSVPNSFYNAKDFGDERLLTKEKWESVLKNFDITESRNYFYIRVKRNMLRRLPVMYMCKLKAKQ